MEPRHELFHGFLGNNKAENFANVNGPFTRKFCSRELFTVLECTVRGLP